MRHHDTSISVRLRALVAVVLCGILSLTAPAHAAICHIPAAVLCEGCATQLTVRVNHDGSCRISFTATEATPITGGKVVDIKVETDAPRTPAHRPGASRLRVAKQLALPRASAPCFVFTGRRYCE